MNLQLMSLIQDMMQEMQQLKNQNEAMKKQLEEGLDSAGKVSYINYHICIRSVCL